MSLSIVRSLYPSYDNATLLALARVQFETAAVNLFVSTLQVCRCRCLTTAPVTCTTL